MQETSMQEKVNNQFNLGNLPPKGHERVGPFFFTLWEQARRHKIEILGLHAKWVELHSLYRGQKKDSKYPTVSANYLFKTINSYCAILTEKTPKAELKIEELGDQYEGFIRAFDEKLSMTWKADNHQDSMYASVQNMEVYGSTVEKAAWFYPKDEPGIILRDPFNFFPAPGFTRCKIEDLPYCCDVDFLPTWKVRKKYNVPENIVIPADAQDQLGGKERETTEGGRNIRKLKSQRHYATNYSSISGIQSFGLDDKALVIEVWVKDDSTILEDVTEQSPMVDEYGQPLVDETGNPIMEDIVLGQEERAVYPDGIRRVVIGNNGAIVYADSPNPFINWGMLDKRVQELMADGIPVPMPVVDEATGQPMIDPATGQPAMQEEIQPIEIEEAQSIIYEQAEKCFLWGRFPFSAIPALEDSSQWWGFSILEQIKDLVGEAERLLTQYFAYFKRAMFPILLNPKGSGVENSQITNQPALILRPLITHVGYFKYLEPPSPPQGMLEAVMFLLSQTDIISGSPEVTEGRRPAGVSAASAIIALQDKAATLAQPQIRNIDRLVENRGKMLCSLLMNFHNKTESIIVDGNPVDFTGTDYMGAARYEVESGSSAPITKAGRRQQFVDLFQMGAMDMESLLERLEIPNYQEVVERLTEQNSLAGALDILIQAGLPAQIAQQLYTALMQPQGGTGRQPEQAQGPQQKQGGSSQPTGPNGNIQSEGMDAAFKQMEGGKNNQ